MRRFFCPKKERMILIEIFLEVRNYVNEREIFILLTLQTRMDGKMVVLRFFMRQENKKIVIDK